MRIFLLTVILTMLLSVEAKAFCGPLAELTELLAKNHEEFPVSVGELRGNAVIILFASKNGKTWTLAVRSRSNQLCPFISGTNWQQGDVEDD